MAPKLYATIASPAVRSVLLTSKALNINLVLDEVDLANQDQFKPNFLKLNPQHTVPTLEDDDGFVIWDSHVINAYLADKYSGFDDSLYPTDLQERSKVAQKLFFDTELATLSQRLFHSILQAKKKSTAQEDVDGIMKKLEILEKFLALSPWVTGTKPTIADFSLIATVTSLDILVPVDAKKFPKIAAWLKKAQALPYYAVNKNGLDKLRNMVAAALEG